LPPGIGVNKDLSVLWNCEINEMPFSCGGIPKSLFEKKIESNYLKGIVGYYRRASLSLKMGFKPLVFAVINVTYPYYKILYLI